MQATYSIANTNFAVHHQNDHLFDKLHQELNQYQTISTPSHTVILQNTSAQLEIPQNSIRTIQTLGETRYQTRDQLYITRPSKISILTDFKNQTLSINYSDTEKDTIELARSAIKWFIIKAAESRGYTYLHASAAQSNDNLLIFAGHSGCGKSSCLTRIHPHSIILSDDNLILNNFTPFSFVLKPSIKGDFESRFSGNNIGNSTNSSFQQPSKINIIFPIVHNSPHSIFKPIPKLEALSRLISIYNREQYANSTLDNQNIAQSKYQELLKSAECYEFYTGSDEQEVTGKLLNFLHSK